MCGFLGYTYFSEGDLDRARAALHTLSHRGPDQWGDYTDANIYLGHRRLSIIDLSERGRQPMVDPAGEIVVAYNGEIYNFPNLKTELSASYTFVSTSDTEVLLHGYREWGLEKLLEKIDGMYAFAIYDRRSGKTYIATDRYGKKPVFYRQCAEGVAFASEVKAIFELEPGARVFSMDGIRKWMYYRGNNSGDTIFKDVRKVPPGTYMEVGKRVEKTKRYYNLLDSAGGGGNDPDDFDSLITPGVTKRLISDVPVGLQLSGGVDSSLVGHYLRTSHTCELHSFSVGFSEEKYSRFSEEEYARFAADKLGFRHHQCNITGEMVADNFEHLVYLFDGMLDYPNSIPIYLLCKYAKDYVTVLLTGEGADELFGGYGKFSTIEPLENAAGKGGTNAILSRLNPAKARLAYLQKQFGGRPELILRDMNSYISHDTFTRLFGEPGESPVADSDLERMGGLPFFRRLIMMDHKTYLYSLLDRQDRASMGASMEARLPFLDRRLVEWAARLDREHLFNGGRNKVILKKKAAQVFGDDFAYRKKMGFPMPIVDWMDTGGLLHERAGRICGDDFLLSGAMDMKPVKDYLRGKSFDLKLLNYGDSERVWIKWYLMVLRTAQDVLDIKGIE